MKPVREWTRDDLLVLVRDRVRESLTLEYKRSDAADPTKTVEISKDVSALANSAGGILIYGLAEDGDHFPTDTDPGVDPDRMAHERLENIIDSNIRPKMQGVVIHPIQLSPGRWAYVLDIPQATASAPHQAADRKYYRRRNFKNEPMEDYEVRDVMRRSTTPLLDLVWTVGRMKARPDDILVSLNLTMHNLSPQPALYSTVEFFVEVQAQPMGEIPEGVQHPLGTPDMRGPYFGFRQRFAAQDQPFYSEAPQVIARPVLYLAPNRRYAIADSITTPGFSRVRFGWIYILSSGALSPQIEWDQPSPI